MDKAARSLSEYTRGHPNNPFGWYLLSKWLYELGRPASGDSALSTASRLFASCGAHSAGAVGAGSEARGLLGLARLQKEMAGCFQDRHFVLLP
jgi:predicted Zn-dependent protease